MTYLPWDDGGGLGFVYMTTERRKHDPLPNKLPRSRTVT